MESRGITAIPSFHSANTPSELAVACIPDMAGVGGLLTGGLRAVARLVSGRMGFVKWTWLETVPAWMSRYGVRALPEWAMFGVAEEYGGWNLDKDQGTRESVNALSNVMMQARKRQSNKFAGQRLETERVTRMVDTKPKTIKYNGTTRKVKE